MTYQTAKLLINAGRVEREHMLSCLDVFLMAGRITMEQYAELLMLLPPEDPAPDYVAPDYPIPDTPPVEVPPEELVNQ